MQYGLDKYSCLHSELHLLFGNLFLWVSVRGNLHLILSICQFMYIMCDVVIAIPPTLYLRNQLMVTLLRVIQLTIQSVFLVQIQVCPALKPLHQDTTRGDTLELIPLTLFMMMSQIPN